MKVGTLIAAAWNRFAMRSRRPQRRCADMNHTLSLTIGPATTAFTSYSDRVPLAVRVPCALSASVRLSAWRLWFVPVANRVPLNRFPPSFGIRLITTPLLVYSAELLPDGV